MLLDVEKLHNTHIEHDLVEPIEKERVEPEVMQVNEIEELQDQTKCFECKETFTKKNALQVSTGKCLLCSILL